MPYHFTGSHCWIRCIHTLISGGSNKPYVGPLLVAVGMHLMSWTLALVVVSVIGVMLTVLGHPLAWFTHKWLMFVLYGIPSAGVILGLHLWRKSRMEKVGKLWEIWLITLGDIAGTNLSVPYPCESKSLQLIWRSSTRPWNRRVPDLQMAAVTWQRWEGVEIAIRATSARWHASLVFKTSVNDLIWFAFKASWWRCRHWLSFVQVLAFSLTCVCPLCSDFNGSLDKPPSKPGHGWTVKSKNKYRI